MRAQGSGSIVNIASVVAVAGQPGYLHYVGSKGAVLAMTKGLAKEVGKHGVRVNVIAPGFVITDATKNRPIEWQQSFLKARDRARTEARRSGRHRAVRCRTSRLSCRTRRSSSTAATSCTENKRGTR